jgi:hypothetical protein
LKEFPYVKALFAAACLFTALPVFAQGLSKEDLASRFFDATTARQIDGMTKNAAAAILKEDPTKKRQAEIYRQWAKESFSSPEYKHIYVTYYVEAFSAEELTAMNEWAKHPLFLSYMSKVPQFAQWSAPRFQQFLASKNPELARRLRAEGFDPSK